jgi:hypothetical protein
MSIHKINLKSGVSYEVRWRDFDDEDINRARRFRTKREAEKFERHVKDVKAKARAEGVISIPGGFDPSHPLAEAQLIGMLDDLLTALHPDHVFTITTNDAMGLSELSLNGSIEWEAQTREDAEREDAERTARFAELAGRHPEIVGDDGEIDYDSDALDAAMDAEPDLFPARAE